MNRHIICVFCLFSIAFISSSCTSLLFESVGRTPFKISAAKSSNQTIVIEENAEIYFWGKSPEMTKINFENLDRLSGLNRPSYVTIEQSISWKSFLYTILTLGIYSPVDYKIFVLSDKGPIN
jgi:hypothetical protein